MGLYKKLPIIIQANQWLGDMSAILKSFPELATCRFVDGKIEVKTLEGIMTAKHGDWIIKGIQGELYPCKPDVFENTYEKIDTSDMVEIMGN
jgi:hypothetical protein